MAKAGAVHGKKKRGGGGAVVPKSVPKSKSQYPPPCPGGRGAGGGGGGAQAACSGPRFLHSLSYFIVSWVVCISQICTEALPFQLCAYTSISLVYEMHLKVCLDSHCTNFLSHIHFVFCC